MRPVIADLGSREIVEELIGCHHIAVDHVEDLQLFVVKLYAAGRAGIVDHNDIEALVGEATHCG